MRVPWSDPVPGVESQHTYHTKKITLIPFWKRMSAFVVDVLLFEMFVARPFAQTRMVEGDLLAAGIMLFTLFFCYQIATQYLLKQTVGMMLFSYRINASLLQIIGRNIYLIPTIPFILLWIADPLAIMFTGKRLSDTWLKCDIERE